MNMMGASKRIMEMFLMRESLTSSHDSKIANVAFSDGSFTRFQSAFSKIATKTAPMMCGVILFHLKIGELCLISCISVIIAISFSQIGQRSKARTF